MNHLAEKAFKAWLEAEGIAVDIHTGLTGEEIPTDSQVISCYVENSEHIVGPLHKIKVQIALATPPHSNSANDESIALTAHKDVLATLRGLVEDFEGSQLETVFNATTGDTFSGGFLEGEDESIENGRWVSVINFMCGVRR